MCSRNIFAASENFWFVRSMIRVKKRPIRSISMLRASHRFALMTITIVNGFVYSLSLRKFANNAGFVFIITSLFLSVFSPAKIFLKLRQHQAQVRQHVGHEQAIGGGIPLNIERYKKIACTIARVQLALVFFYFPLFIFLILATTTDWYKKGSIFHIICINSHLFQFHSKPDPFLLENTPFVRANAAKSLMVVHGVKLLRACWISSHR